MPNYGWVTTSADVSISGDFYSSLLLSTTSEGGSGFSVPCSSSSSRTISFITKPSVPNSDSWESGGTMTTYVDISATDGSDMRGRVRVGRINSSGTTLQTGSYSGYQTFSTTGVYTFSPVAPTWTGGEEACGNRLYVTIEVENTASHGGTKSVSIACFDTGSLTDDSYTTSTITENAGSCSAGAPRRIFLIS